MKKLLSMLSIVTFGDFADEPMFPSKTVGNLEKNQFTTTLGVVATTN
jgi:hypothetical protein